MVITFLIALHRVALACEVCNGYPLITTCGDGRIPINVTVSNQVCQCCAVRFCQANQETLERCLCGSASGVWCGVGQYCNPSARTCTTHVQVRNLQKWGGKCGYKGGKWCCVKPGRRPGVNIVVIIAVAAHISGGLIGAGLFVAGGLINFAGNVAGGIIGGAVAIFQGLIPPVGGQPGYPGGGNGVPGANGVPGQQGNPGENGVTGQPGNPGENGVTGQPGKPGENGVPGQPGNPGEPGVPGKPGNPGEPGVPGQPGSNGGSGGSNYPNDASDEDSAFQDDDGADLGSLEGDEEEEDALSTDSSSSPLLPILGVIFGSVMFLLLAWAIYRYCWKKELGYSSASSTHSSMNSSLPVPQGISKMNFQTTGRAKPNTPSQLPLKSSNQTSRTNAISSNAISSGKTQFSQRKSEKEILSSQRNSQKVGGSSRKGSQQRIGGGSSQKRRKGSQKGVGKGVGQMVQAENPVQQMVQGETRPVKTHTRYPEGTIKRTFNSINHDSQHFVSARTTSKQEGGKGYGKPSEIVKTMTRVTQQ